ncbi:MAG: PEP-CTERM sorting domain-containing protein [Planctomycetes bacterium]|nr:PEP-CTERM sorting domain-containing protein [Planctomycetota bacterium]
MRKLMILSAAIAVLLFLAMPASAQEFYDTFYIQLGPDGEIVQGGGTGYPDGTGAWYTYPSEWINQWFYNGPFDPLRWKKIWGTIVIDPTAADSTVDIVINWATPLWQSMGIAGPPLPELIPVGEEDLMIGRMEIPGFGPGSDPFDNPINFYEEIREFNPEWISIDVMGTDVVISGEIWHECVPEPATLSLLALGGLAVLARRRK